MYQFIGWNEAFVYQNEHVARDYAKAAKWYQRAAERGSAEAAHMLGVLYFDGEDGVKQDYAEAAKWVRKAAERGRSGAAQFLGLMYEEGKGVPQDYVEAAKWYRRAADQGEFVAQYILGRMYFDGNGLAKDYVQAYMWMNLATSLMSAKDREMWDEIVVDRDKLAKSLTPSQQVEAQKLAREWRPIGEVPHMRRRTCE
jgi:TPR repeat protein